MILQIKTEFYKVTPDLLEKLAAMKVQSTQGNQTNQPTQQQTHQYPQNYDSNIATAKQKAIEEGEKKAHRLSINNGNMQQDQHTDISMQGQNNIGKRQKIEDNSRVGSAQQASPQQ
jgi:hypothetical protein